MVPSVVTETASDGLATNALSADRLLEMPDHSISLITCPA
jgi:hypothetical protein